MAKKNWIYPKRGLSEALKHRQAMGNRVWLFMHIVDRADWETGIATEWNDKDEAEDMSMPRRTLQDQRQELEKLGYITCLQQFPRQAATIGVDPEVVPVVRELTPGRGNTHRELIANLADRDALLLFDKTQ